MMEYPKHGDVVFFDPEDGYYYHSGHAVVNGMKTTENHNTYAVFMASVFRPDDGSYVSCSGGPCPFIDKFKFEKVGPYTQAAWNWNGNTPAAGAGVAYEYETTLWKCVGRLDQ
jgi:hypothetical protein